MIFRGLHVPAAFIQQQQRGRIARCLSTSTPSELERTPWFVSVDEPDFPLDVRRKAQPDPPQRASKTPPLPEDTPDYLRKLHSELSTSPFLDASCLVVTRPVEPASGPPLPAVRPKGSRRKRGGTTAGNGIDMPGNGLWSWFVFAQVKEGTEGRGSINRVVKVVRKTLGQLASSDPAVTLPPKGRQSFTDGWAMLDVGHFAVHILSREAREKWFPTTLASIRDQELYVGEPKDSA